MAYYAYYAVCEHCGRDLGMLEQEGGRQRRYCSNACRQAAYRDRKKREKRNSSALRYRYLVKGWRDAGLGEKVVSRLVEMLHTYGPQAAKMAGEIAVEVARKAREAERARHRGE